MGWNLSVLNALRRYSSRHNSPFIARQGLIKEELDRINTETKTTGKTPDKTLNRELQKLRDEGILIFLNRGNYLFLEASISAEEQDYSEAVLEGALLANKLSTRAKLG